MAAVKRYKCLICGIVYGSHPGITSHMRVKHPDNQLAKGVTWEPAPDDTPITASRREPRTGEKNYKCLICGHLAGAVNTMYSHMNHKHDKKARIGHNFVKLSKTSPEEPKRTKQPKPQAIHPGTQYVVIPVMLRVPIVIGAAEFIGNQS